MVLSVLVFSSSSASAASRPSGPAQSLASVELLIKAGALELAIQAIDRYQGQIGDEGWQSWESLRYKLYFQRRQLESLEKRYHSYPSSVPPEFRDWATGQLVQGLLLQGRGEEARQHLRNAIWSSSGSAKLLALWRRQAIEAYLVDDRVDDADLALIQYQRDYPGKSTSWQVFRGRVLIRRGRFADAVDVLTGVQRLDAKIYRLYAGLEAGIYQPSIVIKSARRIGQLKYAGSGMRKRSWLLIARAAAKSGDAIQRIEAMEQAFNIQVEYESVDPILNATSDDLWDAYANFAQGYGNKQRLLVGDDAEWIKHAELFEKKSIVSSRALYAFLALKASIGVMSEIAHKRFTDSLYGEQLGRTAVALYSRSRRPGDLESLPDTVRYRLAIEILRAGDIKLAARIMKTLTQPPAEESVRDWKLRRARTMVYAGEFSEAAQLMQQVLENSDSLPEEYIRRYTQVLFDLQAVGEHSAAATLLSGLYDRTGNREIQRELLYWMAESKLAAGKHHEAAELYLRSAYHGVPKGGDMWGQSARYHAAEALAKSGYIEDARVIYENLLRHTPDAKRRAVIERNLQQLWLKQQKNRTQ